MSNYPGVIFDCTHATWVASITLGGQKRKKRFYIGTCSDPEFLAPFYAVAEAQSKVLPLELFGAWIRDALRPALRASKIARGLRIRR